MAPTLDSPGLRCAPARLASQPYYSIVWNEFVSADRFAMRHR